MEQEELKKYRESGKIAARVMKFARGIVKEGKEGMPLIEIAEEIEQKIIGLGGNPAFPVDVCCNEIAAHSSPVIDDKNIAQGLVKIDIGVSVDGCITDTASSVDLTSDGKFKKMIRSGDEALKKAISIACEGVEVRKLGKAIFETIHEKGFMPIKNLCGHEISRFRVHAGLTVPSYDNNDRRALKKDMVIAIEPFPTTGVGIVINGSNCQIYELAEKKQVRDANARKILKFIESEYKTMPFCARWLAKKFDKVVFYLGMLENQGILRQYPSLIEKSNAPVAQSEHTILVTEKGCEVLTQE